jgi:hypothetical protein
VAGRGGRFRLGRIAQRHVDPLATVDGEDDAVVNTGGFEVAVEADDDRVRLDPNAGQVGPGLDGTGQQGASDRRPA